ncbi:MAG TPA: homoserine dehydrogenase [Pirellulales bacterium]|jgi:homoserine dehydrogenase|nr:homoserine dehydrogenase [Pirellulales bacterium]
MDRTKVGIVGLGTVGSGVARLLLDHADRTTRHAGRRLWLEQVVIQDLEKPRDVTLPEGILSTDLKRITDNKEIAAVAHLVGGLEPARTIMLEVLKSGKDVVTANKALLAEHGQELFDCARTMGRSIAFEAAVAGGIPIIANISQCLSANQILSIRGILNGTCNFILTQMEETGADYDSVLAEAQRRGYAEADPTMDVDGTDTVQKLAILAHLAFGSAVQWGNIPRRGIDQLNIADLRFAKELGYRVKLLAVAELAKKGSGVIFGDRGGKLEPARRMSPDSFFGGLELHASPALVKIGTPLAEVRGAFNAVSLVGDAVGPLFFHGLGAGQMPTASAVMADLIDTVVGRAAITFRSLKLWSDQRVQVELADHACSTGRYYLRFNVADRPGVLADIAGILGRNGISIASVIQHNQDGDDGTVPLVIMTHAAAEGAMREAFDVIGRLPHVRAPSSRFRVYDS